MLTPLLLFSRGSLVLVALVLAGCDSGSDRPSQQFRFTFAEDLEGWTIGFADYPAGASDAEQRVIDDFYELDGGHARLPAPLDTAEGALMLSGNNHSDDLFMFLKRRIGGLAPETTYQLELHAVIATNAPGGCFGVGGPPGESVWVKGGATTIEPLRVADDTSGHMQWIMNIDKGSQALDGADARVLGDFANSKDCGSSDFSYELKMLSLDPPAFEVTADENGDAWLLLGTDSGFEGTTTIYYTEVEAELIEQTSAP